MTHFSEQQLPEGRRSQPILKFFKFEHLPEDLQEVSAEFSAVAEYVYNELPDCAESTVALRKLLEAKDAAVRAALERRE